MKQKLISFCMLTFLSMTQMTAFATTPIPYHDTGGAFVVKMAPLKASRSAASESNTMELNGTNASENFSVDASGLISDITVTATAGFSVTPSVMKAGSENTVVKVTNTTTLRRNTGKVILRSGDIRSYVNVIGLGTPLEQKDLSGSPLYTANNEDEKAFSNFAPDAAKGYTVEFKVKTDSTKKVFYPYAIAANGAGFKGFVGAESMGVYNAADQKGLSNPYNGGTFYNTDGLFHTYRYAVTPDKRVFVYRDGLAIDTLRTEDFGFAEGFTDENGEVAQNLIRNGNFEGEWNKRAVDNLTYRIEGWDVAPIDQYNSTQNIVAEERSNDVDQNNHVLDVNRYKWSDGWGAAQISQVVDVAPNEVYSFSCLAKGGIKSDGTKLASIRVLDLQDANNKQVISVTSDSYQKYACDFTTSAACKQVRVVCYLERDKWGASISDLKVDDVKLTGVSRVVRPQVGFNRDFADLAYFTYDTSGAFAPMAADINAKTTPTEVITPTEEVEATAYGQIVNGVLYLKNLPENASITLCNIGGATILHKDNYNSNEGIVLPGRDIYVCRILGRKKPQSIKIYY